MFTVLTTVVKKEKKKEAIRKPLHQGSIRRAAQERTGREVNQGQRISQVTG